MNDYQIYDQNKKNYRACWNEYSVLRVLYFQILNNFKTIVMNNLSQSGELKYYIH